MQEMEDPTMVLYLNELGFMEAWCGNKDKERTEGHLLNKFPRDASSSDYWADVGLC